MHLCPLLLPFPPFRKRKNYTRTFPLQLQWELWSAFTPGCIYSHISLTASLHGTSLQLLLAWVTYFQCFCPIIFITFIFSPRKLSLLYYTSSFLSPLLLWLTGKIWGDTILVCSSNLHSGACLRFYKRWSCHGLKCAVDSIFMMEEKD